MHYKIKLLKEINVIKVKNKIVVRFIKRDLFLLKIRKITVILSYIYEETIIRHKLE